MTIAWLIGTIHKSSNQDSLGNCPALLRAIESVLYMAECTKADEASEKVDFVRTEIDFFLA